MNINYETHDEYLCEEPSVPELSEIREILNINEQPDSLDPECERGYN